MFDLFKRGLSPKEAIKILEAIPEEEFTTGAFKKGEKCCSIGHLRRVLSEDPTNYNHAFSKIPKVEKLRARAEKYTLKKYKTDAGIIGVNDGDTVNGFTESSPKQRVLHLLKEMG